MGTSNTRPSVSVTAIIWVCLSLMLVGASVALLDIAAGSSIAIETKGIRVSGLHIGLAVFAISAWLLSRLISRLERVQVFSKSTSTYFTRLTSAGPRPYLLLSMLALVLLVLSIVFR
ncbi:hypothetical protein [Candidatus Nitrotoga sp. AM1P]|uniref:hypothetical protein n=1 Tax=Candidatus Nitrotoga sp. AM1P TaxID=2559597 RepID=UPI0015639B71|nr:hypothetical protein [Candidatus Nitrotoga sp. AM1P]